MTASERESLRSKICEYLGCHTTLSLATCYENQVWAANLFYASDDDCQLYFVSSGATRHCRHIARNSQVAVSISGEYSDWGAIKGLQLDGVAGNVADSDRDGVVATYLAKFPSLRRMQRAPRDDEERQIAGRLLQGCFYRISPRWIRLIDNSKGFGHKEEMSFSPMVGS